MLKVRGLTRPGLTAVDLELAGGEAIALLGPSGSGKSLLLRAIADLDPNDGTATLDGARREAMPAPRWRRQVTYLAAEPGWFSDRLADHFPEPPLAEPYLPALGLPPTIMDRAIGDLSTGERHRLALIRVLIQSPKVMLLDEPTSGLDEATTKLVEKVLRDRLIEGAGLLFATHDEALAARLSDRQLRIAQGTVQP